MKQPRDSQKPIALIQRYSEGSVAPGEIQVVPTGTWDHPAYGEMEINSADIAQFVQNFKSKIRLKIPITAGHDTGMGGGEFGELPAIGWFTELIDRGVNGLWGAVEWTQRGKDLIAEGAFKYFSPEFFEQYTDPETGAKYEHVLVGGALTNSPYFKELEPVAFAFSEPNIMNQYKNTMQLKEILAKKFSERSAEERAFVKAHMSELTDAQKKQFDEESDAADKAVKEAEEKDAADKKAAEEKEAADKKAEEERQASERKGKVTMSEAEATLLREKADQGAKAFAELEGMKADKFADKLMFSEKNTDGRFLPKQETAVKAFVRTLSEKQRDQFATIVRESAAPKLSFEEIGDGGKNENASVVIEVETAVKAKMSELKLGYSAALKKVFAENKDLASRYEAHMAGKEE